MLQNFNTLSKNYVEIEWRAKALDSSSSDAMTTASDTWKCQSAHTIADSVHGRSACTGLLCPLPDGT